VFTFPTVIEDSAATEPSEDMPEDAVLEQLSLTNIGRKRERPALSVSEDARKEAAYYTDYTRIYSFSWKTARLSYMKLFQIMVMQRTGKAQIAQ
jgi:hypothetical protein